MTFLNPFLLIGLLAAVIPLLLHLLNLRKLKTLEFSSLQFLQELQKTKMRRVKLRQLLLLLLRTLLIIALVLVFARPALKGSLAGTIGSHARTSMVIMLDDSPSMSVRNERGLLFKQAQTVATQLLTLAKEGDEVHLIRLSEIRHKDFTSGSGQASLTLSSRESMSNEIQQMQVAEETTPFRDAFGIAAKILAESKNFNLEVYLITDAQSTQFTAGVSVADTAALFDQRVKIFLIGVGPAVEDNDAITSVDVKTRIHTQGKPITLQVVVHNFGRAALKDQPLSVYLDGARVVQQSMTIPSLGSATVTCSVVPRRRGILPGYVQIEDDALEIDNKRYFVLHVPATIRVLLVGSTPQDTRFPALALAPGNDTTTEGLFTVQKTLEQEFSTIDVSKFDVVFFCGVRRVSPSSAERLQQFVRSGNGLMIFPGEGIDFANYNDLIFRRLGIPPLLPSARDSTGRPAVPRVDTLGDAEPTRFLSFSNVDYAHPLFAGMFEQGVFGVKTAPAVESPRVLKTLKPQMGSQGRSIITLSDGTGFLMEYPVGQGRVLLVSVEAGLSWSDFPVKGVFAPLVYRAAIYLSAQNESAPSFLAGEPVTFTARPSATDQGKIFVCSSPSGREERIVPRLLSASGTNTFSLTQTSEVGIYSVHQDNAGAAHRMDKGNDPVQSIAVNVDPAESDLRPVRDDQLTAFRSRMGVSVSQFKRLAATADLDRTITETRYGVELWKYFAGLALVLALVEMAVGRESKSSSEQPKEA
jgi:hypothetical protein